MSIRAIVFFLFGLFVVIALANKKHEESASIESTSAAPTTAPATTPAPTSAPFIPTEQDMLPLEGMRFGGGESPLVTPDRLRQALRFILSLEQNPVLQHDLDHKAMALVHDYVDRGRPFKIVPMPSDVPGNMAFSCSREEYAFIPQDFGDAFVAINLYHEIGHAVECGYTNGGKDFDLCEGESIMGYAAQVRMLLAVVKANRMPTTITGADARILQQTVEAWQALVTRRFTVFCEWYQSALANRDAQPTVPVLRRE